MRRSSASLGVGRIGLACWIVSACLGTGLGAQAWSRVPGCARDIAVGHDGSVWIIGCSSTGPGGWSVHHWTGSGWEKVPGSGAAIAVAEHGPWIVNLQGAIYERQDDSWAQRPGCARDIGASGDVYIIGCSQNAAGDPGGNSVYRWSGSLWEEQRYGAGARIAVGPDSYPWIVNRQGRVYRQDRKTVSQGGETGIRLEWKGLPGCAKDIAVDGRNAAWVVGCSPAGGGNSIHRWTGAAWERVEGGATAVGAGRRSSVWVVNSNGEIFRGASAVTSPSSDPPPFFAIEAETLLPSASALHSDNPGPQQMSSFGSGWGGGAQLFWPVPQRDATLRLEPWLLLPDWGERYEVSLVYTRAPDFGAFQVFLDGEPVKAIDGWAPSVTRGSATLGVFQFRPGPHDLRLEVHSKAVSSSGFHVGLDRLEFKRRP